MQIIAMNKPLAHQHFIALLAMLIVAFWMRSYALGAQELRGDEAGSWNFVVQESGPIALVERIIREGDPHPPLHHWILQGWVRIFGDSEWALRTPSAFLSLILVSLVYKFGASVVSDKVGFIAALITALHPFQIWLAQDVRHMYELAIIFVLLGTLKLPGLLRGSYRDWWIYVLAGTLAMYSHYYAIFGFMAHSAYVFLRRDTNRKIWIWASFFVAMLVSPWAIAIIPVYVEGQLADPSTISLLFYLSRIAADFALGPVVIPAVALPVAGLGLALVVHGAVSIPRDKSSAWPVFLVIWPLLTLVGIYVVTTRRGTLNSFYFLVSFPAIYVLLATGWYALLRRSHGFVAATFTALIAIVLVCYALSNYFFDNQWSKNRGLRDVAEILRSHAREDDVFIANFPDPAQDYYLRDVMLDRTMLPKQAQSTRMETRTALQELAGKYRRLWFIPMEALQWDEDSTMLDLLDQGYVREVEYKVGKLELLRFASDPWSVSSIQEVGAAFVAGPELAHVHLAVNGMEATKTISAGDRLRISLVWMTSMTSIDEDYIVFVHLLDSDGMLVASHDGTPVHGIRPTSTWLPGEHVVDVHILQVPVVLDSGLLTLSVGLYVRDTEERQKTVGGGDSIEVFEYTVES